MLLALAGLVGVPYDPVLIVALLGALFLGGADADRARRAARRPGSRQIQAAMPIDAAGLIMPMMFLSGSLFPLAGLPGLAGAWLTRLNPLTYAVQPMRALVFDAPRR